jgi:HlyD family secretion protein
VAAKNTMTNDKEKKEQEIPENRHRGSKRSMLAGKWLWVILIFVVIAIALVLLASMKAADSGSANKSLSTFTVRRDDLTITVTESGSIKARKSIDIKSEVEGQATIISIVPEGTRITEEDVENGKVLVELDSGALEEQLAQREIDFASAEASYAEAKESYDIQLNQNESDVTAAELKVKFSLMDFEKYLGGTVAKKLIEDVNQGRASNVDIAPLLDDPRLSGSALQRLRELDDDITLAEARYVRAKDTLGWTRKLYENKYVAETELKADELDVQSLEIQKKRTIISLELFKLYDFPKQVEQLLSDYREAGRELVRTKARTRSRLAQAGANLKSAESRFDQRMSRLDKVKKQLAACVIKAPAPGLVIYGSSGDPYRRMRGGGRGMIEAGESVHQRQTIISLPNTAEMIAEISVHESSVDKVRPGQAAKIIIDAFPDETFHGEVLKVAPLPDAQRGWLSPDLKVYTTKVSIEGTYDFLKPGMSAKVEILVEQLDEVIIVPVQVVANRGGKKVCYYLSSQGPKEREVRTGAFNDTFVQIIDGLEVGEEVLLNLPRLIEPTAVTKLEQRQRPARDERFELPDEAVERIMAQMAKTNPEEAEKLERLREREPEKFKAELMKTMREQFGKMWQDRGGMRKRVGDGKVREKP